MAYQISNFVRRVFSPRRWLAAAGVVAALSSVSCLNPLAVNQAGGQIYPLAPGDQPFVLMTLINETTASLNLSVLIDTGSSTPVPYTFQNFAPGTHTAGVLVPYPFLRVSLGSLDNPFSPTISGTLPSGLTVQVPFGHPALVAGTDFQKGDTILFDFVADARSEAAITVNLGKIEAATQTGVYRANTFATVTALLAINGVDVSTLTSSTQ